MNASGGHRNQWALHAGAAFTVLRIGMAVLVVLDDLELVKANFMKLCGPGPLHLQAPVELLAVLGLRLVVPMPVS